MRTTTRRTRNQNLDERIATHPMYSATDYAYLRDRGYSKNEILCIWNRDLLLGKEPVQHQAAPDVVGYLSN